MDLKGIRREAVTWINLAVNGDKWQTLMNTDMKLLISIKKTERYGIVVNTLDPYLGGPGFKYRSWRPAMLIEVFRGFRQSFQANADIILQPLPTTSFPVNFHSIIAILSTLV
jgi:hypothetical protein